MESFSVSDFISDNLVFDTVDYSTALYSNEAINIHGQWTAQEGTHTISARITKVSPQDEDESNHEQEVEVFVDNFEALTKTPSPSTAVSSSSTSRRVVLFTDIDTS